MADLTLADEIVVLILDDEEGDIDPGCIRLASVAIAGGILMELALCDRIDSDLTSLFVVDPKPTGDVLLDDVLREIGAEPEQHSSAWWIDRLSTLHGDLIERIQVAARRVRRIARGGTPVPLDVRPPCVSTGLRPRGTGGGARLLSVLFEDEVPDPRDTLLLGLAKSTGILAAILSREELDRAATRIDDIVALEEIGRAVSLVAAQVGDAMTTILVS